MFKEVNKNQSKLLSFMKAHPNDATYNIVKLFEIEGEIDPDRIKSAMEKAMDSCEALRTNFVDCGDYYLKQCDMGRLPGVDIIEGLDEKQILECVRRRVNTPFEIDEWPLIEKSVFESVFSDRSKPLIVGSIKGNVGHLDAASGLTSLIKAVYMLNKSQIPPTVNVEESCFENDNMRLAQGLESSELNLIGISSLGIGGTNVHVILEKYDEADRTGALDDEVKLKGDICYIAPKSCENDTSKAPETSVKSRDFDGLLEEVVQIFCDEIGSDDIDKDTDCLEVDSMDLVVIIDNINRKLNQNLRLNDVTNCETIGDLAKLLYQMSKPNESIIYNFNQNAESDHEYFFVHAAGGSVLTYKHFCDEIGSKRNIFLIDMPKDYKVYKNMEDLARLYVQEILKVHKAGKRKIQRYWIR